MIYDVSALDTIELPQVVVAGSGPAAIALSTRLAEQGVASVLLEAGGLEYSATSQDFYLGQTIGDPYFDLSVARLRQFGGAGNHWYGRCRPMEAWDFEPRDDVPDMGWPIARTDLDPYLEATEAFLNINPTTEDRLSDDLLEIEFTQSPPVMFGLDFLEHFETSELSHLVTNCRVERLVAQDGRVTGMLCRDMAGTERFIETPIAVVAAGGIETSRILLWSNAVGEQRVVADDRALGRYWMEHPHTIGGRVELNPGVGRFRSVFGEFHVAPSPEALRRYSILNGMVRVYPTYQGMEGARRTIKRAICASGEVVMAGAELVGQGVTCAVDVEMLYEQAPIPENRVALSDTDRDAHGVPLTDLHWRVTDFDRRTAQIVFELLGRYLVDTGQGRAMAFRHLIDQVPDPDTVAYGGFHHMGGTRMSATPATGVVDADSRIHGMANAYVAGSSVFPTGGHANPTQTIVLLSMRLADHIAGLAI